MEIELLLKSKCQLEARKDLVLRLSNFAEAHSRCLTFELPDSIDVK